MGFPLTHGGVIPLSFRPKLGFEIDPGGDWIAKGGPGLRGEGFLQGVKLGIPVNGWGCPRYGSVKGSVPLARFHMLASDCLNI